MGGTLGPPPSFGILKYKKSWGQKSKKVDFCGKNGHFDNFQTNCFLTIQFCVLVAWGLFMSQVCNKSNVYATKLLGFVTATGNVRIFQRKIP